MTYRRLHAGKLPGAVKIDGRWWVHVGKLRTWLDSLANGNTGQSAA